MTGRTRPLLITLGDPAGIGPEVAARVLARGGLPEPIAVVGCRWNLDLGAKIAGVRLPDMPDADSDRPQPLSFIDLGDLAPPDFRMGEVSADAGRIAVRSVEHAARLCLDGRAAAMVTCPINKAAIHAAGYVDDIGHQEILARMTGAVWTATLLMTPGLKVAHLSTHKSLIDAARYVTRANLHAKLTLLDRTLRAWGMPAPRIAVAALNPHGGEAGLLGREEIDEISPAVALLAAEGMRVTGPIPADSVFYRAIAGEFDVVLALYHDQGHIAIKVHNFQESTTATLGIPFVRTSVDHGTAFDIAGRGVADETGLGAALRAADAIARGALHEL